jgi:hypothetical protein
MHVPDDVRVHLWWRSTDQTACVWPCALVAGAATAVPAVVPMVKVAMDRAVVAARIPNFMHAPRGDAGSGTSRPSHGRREESPTVAFC